MNTFLRQMKFRNRSSGLIESAILEVGGAVPGCTGKFRETRENCLHAGSLHASSQPCKYLSNVCVRALRFENEAVHDND